MMEKAGLVMLTDEQRAAAKLDLEKEMEKICAMIYPHIPDTYDCAIVMQSCAASAVFTTVNPTRKNRFIGVVRDWLAREPQ